MWFPRPIAFLALLGAFACTAALGACSSTSGNAESSTEDLSSGAAPVALAIDAPAVATSVSERFLSFSVDTAQVVGADFWSRDPNARKGVEPTSPYDFGRAKLLPLVRALAPAYLRIGGTDADRIFYDLDGIGAPGGFKHVLTREQWDGVNRFAESANLEIMFTLNAGPSQRNDGNAWQTENAKALVSYTARQGYPVTVWELGNEISAYPVLFDAFAGVSAAQYADDLSRARSMVHSLMPRARLAGPSSPFWPVIGEASPSPLMEGFLERAGASVDIVTWHYYPQESSRCPVRVRSASPYGLTSSDHLDEFERWAAQVEGAAAKHTPNAEVWVGETGNAQCGGEPGVSDRFVASLWWLDQLGVAARRGEQVVVRQNLSGAAYSLLDDDTLTPRPDYWASLLWRRLMGTRVLSVSQEAAPNSAVRAYAHCTSATAPDTRAGAVTLLVLNQDHVARSFHLPHHAGESIVRYAVTAPNGDPLSATANLESVPLALDADGEVPTLRGTALGASSDPTVILAPYSYAFVVLPDANERGCL